MSETIPEGLVPGLAIQWPFESSTVRISRYRCEVAAPGTSDEQSQPWHVIAFPHGRPFVHHGDGGDAVIDPTRLLLLNAGDPYRTSHPFGYGDSGSSLVLRRDVLLEAIAVHHPDVWERPERPFAVAHAPSSPAVYLTERLLLRQLEQPEGLEPLAVTETALALAAAVVASVFGATKRRRIRDRTEPWVGAVQEAIAKHYERPWSLEDLAALAGVSVYHLCRTFRARTGLTVHRYRNRLRLRAALARLAGPVDLTELALDLGFSSHSHFTAAFRAEFGIPPSRVRGRTAL